MKLEVIYYFIQAFGNKGKKKNNWTPYTLYRRTDFTINVTHGPAAMEKIMKIPVSYNTVRRRIMEISDIKHDVNRSCTLLKIQFAFR
jgi:hypothetical protein